MAFLLIPLALEIAVAAMVVIISAACSREASAASAHQLTSSASAH